MKVHVKVTDDKNQTYEGTLELTKSRKQKDEKQIEIKIRGPADVVKELYFQNYFEQERKLNEVEKKFKSKKYNFDLAVIAKALDRAKYLTREGKRTKYTYIQKIPPT